MNLAIALDGSRYGVAALRFFVKNRDLFGATPTLTLVHVVPDLLNFVVPGYFGRVPAPRLKSGQVEAMQKAAFENALAPARKLLERAGVTAKEIRLFGNDAAERTATYATKNKLDLLALGSLGHGARESAVLGSVATRIAAQCQVPPLFVREE